jgi:hypothetical protein
MTRLLIALALLLAAAPAFAADNYTVKDASGSTLTIGSKDVGSSVHATKHVPVDASGNPTTGTTGSAVPSAASYQGRNVGGNLTGVIGCGSSVVYDASTSGSTELVALSGSTVVYVCGYTILAAGTVNVKLVYGSGTACATGETAITPSFQLTTQTGVADSSPTFRGLKGVAAKALCIKTSGAVAVQAIVYYSQF